MDKVIALLSAVAVSSAVLIAGCSEDRRHERNRKALTVQETFEMMMMRQRHVHEMHHDELDQRQEGEEERLPPEPHTEP